MVLLTNSFDGVTPSGTAVTAGNSGGASGNAFDTVTTGTGAAVTSDSAQAHSGGLSAHFTTGGTAAQTTVAWGTSAGTNTQVWFRLYLYVTANPAVKQQVGGWTITGGSGFAGSLNLNANGTLRYEDSAFATVTGTTTTNSIATNQWVRLEGFVLGSATVGQYELKLFNSTDSAVPTETVTSTALQNSGGPITGMLFGATPKTANVNYWQDDIGLSSTGYLGPSQIPVPAAQWRQHAGRRKGRRFGAQRSQQQASFVTETAQVLPVIQVSPPEAVQHGATW